MDRQRVVLVVCVDLDPMPGVMHTEESARFTLQAMLHERMPHYRPTVYSESFMRVAKPTPVSEPT